MRLAEDSHLSALPCSSFSSALLAPEGTDTLCSMMGSLPYMPRNCTCSACPVERADELNFLQEKKGHCACRVSWVFVGGVDKNISNFHIIREKMHVAASTQASSLSEFVVKFPLESKKNNSSQFLQSKG